MSSTTTHTTTDTTTDTTSSTTTLLARNQHFAGQYTGADLPIMPKLRTVILTCVDSRVDPAYVFGLELGDAAVIRNSGGRVTQDVIEELAILALMARQMNPNSQNPFEVVVMHHTQCGAERFAMPELQNMIKDQLWLDVADKAIHNHDESVQSDIEKLRNAKELPGSIQVSGYVYDVSLGTVREVIAPGPLR